jgi:lathosterol oxidase
MTQNQRIQIGEGRISGYLSIFLALICFFGIVCAFYPEYLTTADFREAYNPLFIKWSLLGVALLSLGFAITSFILSRRTTWGFIGIVILITSIILGSFLPESDGIESKAYTLGLDWLVIDIFISALIFIPIELFLPKRLNQSKFHSEWRTDLVYFIIGHLLIQVTGVVVQLPSVKLFGGLGLDGLQTWVKSIHFVPQLLLAMFAADLFQSTAHLLFHKIPFLWRFHSVHHSTKNIDWLAGSRTHFVDLIVVRALTFMPIYLLGLDTSVFTTYLVIAAMQAVLAHANTRINFGFLRYVFVTPQYHHWHHSAEEKAYDKNYAIHFPLIDMLFGTYFKSGKNEWPKETGLGEVQFPKGFIRQFIYPFANDPMKQQKEIENPSER